MSVLTMNGVPSVVGKNYTVSEISSKVANDIVKLYHYSKKVVTNSKLHLGVFCNVSGRLVGCLQYGPSMNGLKTTLKISDNLNVFELNRMVMDDVQPRNSESQAISLCNKWLQKHSKIDWLLSFSDGKEGNVGYIYQATNWKYIGYLVSDSFYLLDGHYRHNVTVWHQFKEKHPLRDSHTTDEIVCMNFDNVSKVMCKQHVYVFPLRRGVVFKFEDKPYPKLETEVCVLASKTLKQNGFIVEKPSFELFTDEKLHTLF